MEEDKKKFESHAPAPRKFSTPNITSPLSGRGESPPGSTSRKYSVFRPPAGDPFTSSLNGPDRKSSSASSSSGGSTKSKKWKFPFFSGKSKPDIPPMADSPIDDDEFQPICPPLNLSFPDDNGRPQEISRDMQKFFDQRSDEGSPPPNLEEGQDDYSWQSPTSWGFMNRDTYAINTRPRQSSLDKAVDLDQIWALRVFKPVETSDGVMSKIVASSGYTYVTISCTLDCTALELCQRLLRKFTSNRDLSRYRLYIVHRNTERLLEHEDKPVQLLKKYLKLIGYTEDDPLSKIAREDHSYCCRFIYREYPPPPPRSEDFVDSTGNVHEKISFRIHGPRQSTGNRARITKKSAQLSDVNLSVLPTVMFLHASTLEYIDLSRNTLLTLPDDLFEMLVNLKLLRLIGNLMTKIPAAILACPSITHLDLSSNNLDGDALAPLASMPNLTHLNVSCNRISELPVEIEAMKTLRNLDISSNYLTELPSCLWEMNQLREINASFNRITCLPEGITKLVHLRTLILVGNSIETVDERLKELPELRQFDLRGNLLKDMTGLGCLSSLTEVSIDYNQLSTIKTPKWPHVTSLSCINNHLTGVLLGDSLIHLRKLDLSVSNLVSLPEDIFTYTPNLDCLLLSDNQITRLPQSINNLCKLEKLVACGNSITEVSLKFSQLPLLEHLNLYMNNIRSVTEEIWYSKSLKVLNLSSNFLTEFPAPPLSLETLPLSQSLEEFSAAENRLADDVGDVIVHFGELRVLNLSYNRVFDLGDALRDMPHLIELYLSGNGMTAFPDDIDRCISLRMLFVNGNKLANIPGELGKIENLTVFDCQSNVLKYNISNWPYDWNWNFNGDLQYLNIAHNRKLEIKPSQHSTLADFKSMSKLRVLDVSEVLVSPTSLPQSVTNLELRTCPDQSNLMVAIADYCGRETTFDILHFCTTSFMGQEKDHLVGLFDGRGHEFVASYVRDTLEDNLKMELRRMRQGEEFSAALRRAFLSTNRDLSLQPVEMQRGATACLLYLLENQMVVANVGDTMAVLSREGSAQPLTTKHHPWMRAEQARIRDLGGYISLQGFVEGETCVTRAFGHHHLLPFINSNPSITEHTLGPKDEFVLIASWSFWQVMPYQMAIDTARRERSDPTAAVQKLRDMAIARGVVNSLKIIFVDFRGITSSAQFTEDARSAAERRRAAFRRAVIDDQVLSRLEEEATPPKPPCAFVFTDIKDSTKLWSLLPNAMRVAIKQHNNLMRRLMRIHRGYEVKTEGDAFVVAFQSPIDALFFCLAVQEQFLATEWPREILDSPVASPVHDSDGSLLYRGLAIRMGIHFGQADDEEDKVARRMDYHGIHVIISARVSSLADGGQIYLTKTVMDHVDVLPIEQRPEMAIFDLGMTTLKGLPQPEHIFCVYPVNLAGRHRYRSDSVKSLTESAAALSLSSPLTRSET